MRKFVVAMMAVGVLFQWAPVSAQIESSANPPRAQISASEGPLTAAVKRDYPIARARESSARPRPAQSEQKQRSWIGRHPALFGALVGAGAGLIAGGTMNNELICQQGNDEDCVFYNGSRFAVGAGIGAGIGALVGWIVSLGR